MFGKTFMQSEMSPPKWRRKEEEDEQGEEKLGGKEKKKKKKKEEKKDKKEKEKKKRDIWQNILICDRRSSSQEGVDFSWNFPETYVEYVSIVGLKVLLLPKPIINFQVLIILEEWNWIEIEESRLIFTPISS